MDRVLILGGTSEARSLAALLEPTVEVISALAGRVANPALPVGTVRIGGFGGAAGLQEWLIAEQITAMVDATHPFAATITTSALLAAEATGIALLGVRRPGWSAAPDDHWTRVPGITEAAELLGRHEPTRVFLTTGRRDLAAFASLDQHWFLIRSVDSPEVDLPVHSTVLLDRGPYPIGGETELLTRNRIQVLVTKDSGGELTRAKLIAARNLHIAVIMVNRPAYPLTETVATAAQAADWVLDRVRGQPG